LDLIVSAVLGELRWVRTFIIPEVTRKTFDNFSRCWHTCSLTQVRPRHGFSQRSTSQKSVPTSSVYEHFFCRMYVTLCHKVPVMFIPVTWMDVKSLQGTSELSCRRTTVEEESIGLK